MGGDHCFLPGGNGTLVQALVENVSILYEKTVQAIRYTSDGVQVAAGGQVYDGELVLCTVPLGVLKCSSIKFIPELPQRKLDGIKSYATVDGGPILIALVAGEAAHKFETMEPTDAVTRVLLILKVFNVSAELLGETSGSNTQNLSYSDGSAVPPCSEVGTTSSSSSSPIPSNSHLSSFESQDYIGNISDSMDGISIQENIFEDIINELFPPTGASSGTWQVTGKF